MSGVAEDPSMLFFRIDGVDLASASIAVQLGQLLIGHLYGREELAKQIPLKLTEKEDTWLVEVSRIYDDSEADGDIVPGHVAIEIVKANCQVVRLVRYAGLAGNAGDVSSGGRSSEPS
jgi:hypothetical protein